MKIIHTSDWHLGQSFYGKSREAEHKSFLDWLLEQVEIRQIDAIIVAGDIFDTGTPPSYARALYNQFVVALQRYRCQLVILAGNHDSVAMLNESKQLFSYLNTHLIADVQPDNLEHTQAQIVELDSVYQTSLKAMTSIGAIVCAIPFIRPRDIQRSQASISAKQKQQDLQQAIAEHYQSLFEAAQQRVAKLGYDVPIIMTGHLTTVGATSSDSVRDIYIGTLDAFPANAFPNADYIALGHIHRSQAVAKSAHIHYSGSPIALSFDELNRAKSVNLVEFAEGKLTQVQAIEVPEFQPMQVIKGDLATITARLNEFEADDEQGLNTWLDIEVSSQDYLNDLQSRIQALCADKPVEVLVIRRARTQAESSLNQQDKETLAELNVNDVFERRLALEDISEPQRLTRLRSCFQQAFSQVEQQSAQDKLEASR
ncbi:exonuclease subunit SbcD [Saccharobesus litoralis]|uniref:Nuclease SbcCD subunit D n=1 Tax=Saccharobesus litoralis TaxID=2172099 RepID=A0A2S0VQW1_9ALTE|nr:exonuclease subunit SbcD [Saccharobesus litoralis]AWB66603.1 exonuclease subunit SbcD [Saccharobesus litoralis]